MITLSSLLEEGDLEKPKALERVHIPDKWNNAQSHLENQWFEDGMHDFARPIIESYYSGKVYYNDYYRMLSTELTREILHQWFIYKSELNNPKPL